MNLYWRHERRPEDALLGYQGRDQLQGSGIECRVVGIYSQGGETHSAQGADLLRVPFLYYDILLAVCPVEGGEGRGHIEGDPMVFGQDGMIVGPDVIEDRIPGDPVRSHILPLRIRLPDMLSQIRVTGILSSISSQAVRREPWCRGRVSQANTWIFFPNSVAERTTPRAVPQPTQANLPALQWVRMVSPSSKSLAPFRPMARLIRMSSSAISSADRSAASRISSVLTPSPASFRALSTPQERLIAVGRELRIISAAISNSSIISNALLAWDFSAARAML